MSSLLSRRSPPPLTADPATLPVRRLQQKRQEWAQKGHGEYNEIEEKDFFKVWRRQRLVGLAWGVLSAGWRLQGMRQHHRHEHLGTCLCSAPMVGMRLTRHPAPTNRLPQEMKGEERMVCHFYRNSMPCKVGASVGTVRGTRDSLRHNIRPCASNHHHRGCSTVHAASYLCLLGLSCWNDGLARPAAGIHACCMHSPPAPPPLPLGRSWTSTWRCWRASIWRPSLCGCMRRSHPSSQASTLDAEA